MVVAVLVAGCLSGLCVDLATGEFSFETSILLSRYYNNVENSPERVHRSYNELEVKERCNISPTTTIHLIHDDDRDFSEMTTSMNSDASNDMDLVKHHDGTLSSVDLS